MLYSGMYICVDYLRTVQLFIYLYTYTFTRTDILTYIHTFTYTDIYTNTLLSVFDLEEDAEGLTV